MCWSQLKTIFEVLQSVATIIGIAIGGAWVWFLYKRQGDDRPRIEMSSDIIFHKKIGDWWIVELVVYVENKGKVQHKMRDFNFDLHSINTGDTVDIVQQFGDQAYFPNTIAKGSFLNKNMKYFFLEPGVKGKYSYVARVPALAEAIILHAWFNYDSDDKVHGTEKTAVVPKDSVKSNDSSATREKT
jgi:hypothetical protein